MDTRLRKSATQRRLTALLSRLSSGRIRAIRSAAKELRELLAGLGVEERPWSD